MTLLDLVQGKAARSRRPTAGPPTATAAERGVLVETVADAAWEDDLAGFADSSLEQSATYCGGRWGARRDSHIMLREGTTTLAMARVVTLAAPVIGGGIAFVKFGPVWRPTAGCSDVAVYRRMLAELSAEYCRRRGLLLVVQPRPNPDHLALEDAALREQGFVPRRPMAAPDRFFVDLALGENEQRQGLGQKWRYNLKKAERAGVSVALVHGKQGFDLFAGMHAKMVARKDAAHGDPIELLPLLHERLPPSTRPVTAIARHAGEAVAGAVVARFGDTAYYLYGASTDQALQLNAGYCLQWWLVGWLSTTGVRWYDLGGAPQGSALRQFKSGLAGKRGRIVPQIGEMDYWVRPRQRFVADTLFWLRGAGARRPRPAPRGDSGR